MNSEDISNPSGWFTGHCDGGSRGNPGPAGFGAVIEGPDGQCVAQLSQYLGVITNNLAEYSGLIAVLAWSIENGVRRLRVISDSLLMVNQIKRTYKVKNPQIKVMWARAIEMIEMIDAFEITHTLREGNKTADMLANQAMDRGQKSPSTESVWTVPEAMPVRPAAGQTEKPAARGPVPLYRGVNDQQEFWQSEDRTLCILRVREETGWTAHRDFKHVESKIGGEITAEEAAALLNAVLSNEYVWQRKGKKFNLIPQSSLLLPFAG